MTWTCSHDEGQTVTCSVPHVTLATADLLLDVGPIQSNITHKSKSFRDRLRHLIVALSAFYVTIYI